MLVLLNAIAWSFTVQSSNSCGSVFQLLTHAELHRRLEGPVREELLLGRPSSVDPIRVLSRLVDLTVQEY